MRWEKEHNYTKYHPRAVDLRTFWKINDNSETCARLKPDIFKLWVAKTAPQNNNQKQLHYVNSNFSQLQTEYTLINTLTTCSWVIDKRFLHSALCRTSSILYRPCEHKIHFESNAAQMWTLQ